MTTTEVMLVPNDATFYAMTSAEFEQLSQEEMHELDIQTMQDEDEHIRILAVDLSHSEQH